MAQQTSPKAWWTYRGGWENEWLLNSRLIPVLTSLIVAGVLNCLFFESTTNIVGATADRLPGSLLAIIGFVLTALAIMASADEASIAGTLREKDPSMWGGIVRYFSLTAKAAAALALMLAIIPTAWPGLMVGADTLSRVNILLLTALIVWVAQLILGSLVLLERGVTKHPAVKVGNGRR